MYSLSKRVTLVAVIAMGTGCGDGSDRQKSSVEGRVDSDPNSVVVARIETSTGSTVEFVDAGLELGVSVIGLSDIVDLELQAAFEAANGDMLQFYEGLSGERAPQTLTNAVERFFERSVESDELAAEEDDEFEQQQGDGVEPFVERVSSLSSALNSNFCRFGVAGGYQYCWPNLYSEPWVQRKADSMYCRVDAYGSMRVRYRFKKTSGWQTPSDYWISFGSWWGWYGFYSHAKRHRRCEVVSNPNTTKLHFRVGGATAVPAFVGAPPVFWPEP